MLHLLWATGDYRRQSLSIAGMGTWMPPGKEKILTHIGLLLLLRTRPGCARAGGSSVGMAEDCLYLNVFTKNLVKTNQRSNYDQV